MLRGRSSLAVLLWLPLLGACAGTVVGHGVPGGVAWTHVRGSIAGYTSDEIPVEQVPPCADAEAAIWYRSEQYVRGGPRVPSLPPEAYSRPQPESYDGDASLPPDARDTGWRRDGRGLWLSPGEMVVVDGTVRYRAVYVVEGARVQRWPLRNSRCL